VGVSWTIGLTNRDDRFLYHMVYLSAIVNVEMIEVTRGYSIEKSGTARAIVLVSPDRGHGLPLADLTC
jgi:hypothetical protein